MRTQNKILADTALLFLALIWGSTFVMVKEAVSQVGIFTFLAMRFWIAAFVLLVLYHRRWLQSSRREILAGCLLGLFLLGGYFFQTAGLIITTASKAGVITGLYVVLVPFLSGMLIKRPAERQALLGISLATPGLFLLSLQGDFSLAPGDLLVVVSTLFWALQVVYLGRFSPEMDTVTLAGFQILVVAALSLPLAWFLEKPTLGFGGGVWFAAFFTGALATAFALLIQVWAQRTTSPTRTAIILAMEPVFAAFFGYLLAGDRLSGREILGAALILAGMLVAEISLFRRTRD